MSIAHPPSEAAIFGRILNSDSQPVPIGLASFIVNMRLASSDEQRVNSLAEKARQGALSPDEEDELQSYQCVGDLLAVWQSKARQILKNSPALI